ATNPPSPQIGLGTPKNTSPCQESRLAPHCTRRLKLQSRSACGSLSNAILSRTRLNADHQPTAPVMMSRMGIAIGRLASTVWVMHGLWQFSVGYLLTSLPGRAREHTKLLGSPRPLRSWPTPIPDIRRTQYLSEPSAVTAHVL